MYAMTRLRIGSTRIFMGKGVRELLEAIDRHHSIKQASAATGISYPKAARMLRTFEEELGFPAVLSQKGGSSRGGTRLTPEGRAVLERYSEIEQAVARYAQQLVDERFSF